MSTNIVIVTACFLPWKPEFQEHVDFIGDIGCPCYIFYGEEEKSFSFRELQRYTEEKYPHVYIRPLGNIYYLMTDLFQLPSNRNLQKDTEEHMWRIHSKIACLHKVVEEHDYTPNSFLWMDFDSNKLCSNGGKYVQKYLKELLNLEYFHFPMNDINTHGSMIIPGCWKKLSETSSQSPEILNILNNIQWRFCGNILWGNSEAIRHFWRLYKKHFSKLLLEYGILTWEVNFWALLEVMEPEWKPIWYYGDHNDSMFRLIGEITALKWKEQLSYVSSSYKYIEIERYRPMSASYIFFQGKHLLNTRFVNYWICDTGGYWFPPEEKHTIRTKNILSELQFTEDSLVKTEILKPVDFKEMTNKIELEFYSAFSEGIEDIRIFEKERQLYFIGSTMNYTESKKIRMMIGQYDMNTFEMKNGYIVEPPSNTWCEKNWIPICNPEKQEEMYYIYKWCPMEIGQVQENQEDSTYKLHISIKHNTNPCIFGNIRGSSCFILDTIDGTEGLLGVVHFSEENSPRKYYHRLVLLDKHTFIPLKYTECFVFEKIGVEFCIGFTSVSNKYVCWISQMDRDPLMIEIDKTDIGQWNTH